MNAPTIGFIGLGLMGAPMALNLARAGHRLVVHDKRREAADSLVAAGATWADTPRATAAQCDAVFTCLPGLPEIEAVALGEDGILAGIREDRAFFEMSTNSLDLVKRLHAAFAARRAHMLEAPVSGGPGVHTGRLAIWVGGDRDVYDRFEDVLRAIGDRPLHVGKIGAGLVTKLVHNCASQTMQAALAEVFTMGVKAGADPLALWEAIRQGSIGRRRSFDGLADRFLPARYDENPDAALRIIHKDMTLATGLAREIGMPMRFANLALADIVEAMNRGWAERDSRSVMQLPQERAGVRIAVDAEAVREVMRRDPPAPTDTRFGKGA